MGYCIAAGGLLPQRSSGSDDRCVDFSRYAMSKKGAVVWAIQQPDSVTRHSEEKLVAGAGFEPTTMSGYAPNEAKSSCEMPVGYCIAAGGLLPQRSSGSDDRCVDFSRYAMSKKGAVVWAIQQPDSVTRHSEEKLVAGAGFEPTTFRL